MSYKAAKKLVKEGRVAGKIAKAMNTRKKTVYAGDIKKIEVTKKTGPRNKKDYAEYAHMAGCSFFNSSKFSNTAFTSS